MLDRLSSQFGSFLSLSMNDYVPTIPTPNSERDCDDRFYEILGGGAKFSLLEGFIDLQLPEVSSDH
jgi:hypothetical protein